ncbi:MAG: hypothetical protein HYT80_08015 [Euryarchaeota archaeon]|nr:hypothetical protein [Euryarchaeota archaeon]
MVASLVLTGFVAGISFSEAVAAETYDPAAATIEFENGDRLAAGTVITVFAPSGLPVVQLQRGLDGACGVARFTLTGVPLVESAWFSTSEGILQATGGQADGTWTIQITPGAAYSSSTSLSVSCGPQNPIRMSVAGRELCYGFTSLFLSGNNNPQFWNWHMGSFSDAGCGGPSFKNTGIDELQEEQESADYFSFQPGDGQLGLVQDTETTYAMRSAPGMAALCGLSLPGGAALDSAVFVLTTQAQRFAGTDTATTLDLRTVPGHVEIAAALPGPESVAEFCSTTSATDQQIYHFQVISRLGAGEDVGQIVPFRQDTATEDSIATLTATAGNNSARLYALHVNTFAYAGTDLQEAFFVYAPGLHSVLETGDLRTVPGAVATVPQSLSPGNPIVSKDVGDLSPESTYTVQAFGRHTHYGTTWEVAGPLVYFRTQPDPDAFVAPILDADEDGASIPVEALAGSNAATPLSSPETDDDGDGTQNLLEPWLGLAPSARLLCSGAYGVVVSPACGGYAAPAGYDCAPNFESCELIHVEDVAPHRVWVWDSTCLEAATGIYTGCRASSNHGPAAAAYDGGFAFDGWGWRTPGVLSTVFPLNIPVPSLCSDSPHDDDGDGIPQLGLCSRLVTVFPDGSFSTGSNETLVSGPIGDPDDGAQSVPEGVGDQIPRLAPLLVSFIPMLDGVDVHPRFWKSSPVGQPVTLDADTDGNEGTLAELLPASDPSLSAKALVMALLIERDDSLDHFPNNQRAGIKIVYGNYTLTITSRQGHTDLVLLDAIAMADDLADIVPAVVPGDASSTANLRHLKLTTTVRHRLAGGWLQLDANVTGTSFGLDVADTIPPPCGPPCGEEDVEGRPAPASLDSYQFSFDGTFHRDGTVETRMTWASSFDREAIFSIDGGRIELDVRTLPLETALRFATRSVTEGGPCTTKSPCQGTDVHFEGSRYVNELEFRREGVRKFNATHLPPVADFSLVALSETNTTYVKARYEGAIAPNWDRDLQTANIDITANETFIQLGELPELLRAEFQFTKATEASQEAAATLGTMVLGAGAPEPKKWPFVSLHADTGGSHIGSLRITHNGTAVAWVNKLVAADLESDPTLWKVTVDRLAVASGGSVGLTVGPWIVAAGSNGFNLRGSLAAPPDWLDRTATVLKLDLQTMGAAERIPWIRAYHADGSTNDFLELQNLHSASVDFFSGELEPGVTVYRLTSKLTFDSETGGNGLLRMGGVTLVRFEKQAVVALKADFCRGEGVSAFGCEADDWEFMFGFSPLKAGGRAHVGPILELTIPVVYFAPISNAPMSPLAFSASRVDLELDTLLDWIQPGTWRGINDEQFVYQECVLLVCKDFEVGPAGSDCDVHADVPGTWTTCFLANAEGAPATARMAADGEIAAWLAQECIEAVNAAEPLADPRFDGTCEAIERGGCTPSDATSLQTAPCESSYEQACAIMGLVPTDAACQFADEWVCSELDTDNNSDCAPPAPTPSDVENATCAAVDVDGSGDCDPGVAPCDLPLMDAQACTTANETEKFVVATYCPDGGTSEECVQEAGTNNLGLVVDALCPGMDGSQVIECLADVLGYWPFDCDDRIVIPDGSNYVGFSGCPSDGLIVVATECNGEPGWQSSDCGGFDPLDLPCETDFEQGVTLGDCFGMHDPSPDCVDEGGTVCNPKVTCEYQTWYEGQEYTYRDDCWRDNQIDVDEYPLCLSNDLLSCVPPVEGCSPGSVGVSPNCIDPPTVLTPCVPPEVGAEPICVTPPPVEICTPPEVGVEPVCRTLPPTCQLPEVGVGEFCAEAPTACDVLGLVGVEPCPPPPPEPCQEPTVGVEPYCVPGPEELACELVPEPCPPPPPEPCESPTVGVSPACLDQPDPCDTKEVGTGETGATFYVVAATCPVGIGVWEECNDQEGLQADDCPVEAPDVCALLDADENGDCAPADVPLCENGDACQQVQGVLEGCDANGDGSKSWEECLPEELPPIPCVNTDCPDPGLDETCQSLGLANSAGECDVPVGPLPCLDDPESCPDPGVDPNEVCQSLGLADSEGNCQVEGVGPVPCVDDAESCPDGPEIDEVCELLGLADENGECAVPDPGPLPCVDDSDACPNPCEGGGCEPLEGCDADMDGQRSLEECVPPVGPVPCLDEEAECPLGPVPCVDDPAGCPDPCADNACEALDGCDSNLDGQRTLAECVPDPGPLPCVDDPASCPDPCSEVPCEAIWGCDEDQDGVRTWVECVPPVGPVPCVDDPASCPDPCADNACEALEGCDSNLDGQRTLAECVPDPGPLPCVDDPESCPDPDAVCQELGLADENGECDADPGPVPCLDDPASCPDPCQLVPCGVLDGCDANGDGVPTLAECAPAPDECETTVVEDPGTIEALTGRTGYLVVSNCTGEAGVWEETNDIAGWQKEGGYDAWNNYYPPDTNLTPIPDIL